MTHKAISPQTRASLARGSLLAVLWTLALASSPARAEGPGILLGERLVLHPGVATEIRYDSNLFFSNQRTGEGLPTGAFLLRILPSVDLTTVSLARGGLAAQKFDFRLHAGVDYREYLSPDPFVSQHRNIGIDVSAIFRLFPRGAFNLDIYDNFLRSNQLPYNPYVNDKGLSNTASYNFDRDTNLIGLRARYSPGGQRLTISLSWEFGFDGFEDADGIQLSLLNQITNDLNLRASWKFLPKTALYIDVDWGVQRYLTPLSRQPVPRPDAYPLRVGAGLMGLITQKLSVDLYGGYGNGFYVHTKACPVLPGDECTPSTGIVKAEIKYKPTFLSSISTAYRYDFVNSLIGAYFILSSASLSYSQLIYRLSVMARFSWDRMEFHGTEELLRGAGICEGGEVKPCVVQRDRVDNYLVFDIKGEYPIREWLIPSVGYTLQSNVSNGYNRVHAVIVPVTFLKHEAWIRLTVRY